MTRFVYGGGGDAEVVSPTGVPRASAPAGVYSARVGGSLVTDILDMSGTGLSGTVTTDAFGQAIFQGPDAYTATLWLDFGTGPRWGVAPKMLDQPNGGGQLIKDQRTVDYSTRTATVKSALPQQANIPLYSALVTALDPLVTPRFPSLATRNAAFPSPNDGDQCYRTDLHAGQVYSSNVARWVTDQALISEIVLANNTTNSVTFSSIPQEWQNLRLVIVARCATSAQTHKYGVETFLGFNSDTVAANYALNGWSRLDKWTASTATYGISSVDATGGSTTTSAPVRFFGAPFAGDLESRVAMIAGESTPTHLWSMVDCLLPDYSTSGNAHQGFQARGAGSVFGTTSYTLNSDYSGAWNNTNAVTSILVSLFTGAFFASGSTLRLYGS